MASPGGVVYWMSREQRVQDNWALLHAHELAMKNRVGLSVIFCIAPSFLGATMRHYDFLLRGLFIRNIVFDFLNELGVFYFNQS